MKTDEQIRKARTNKMMKFGCLPIVIIFGVLFIAFTISTSGSVKTPTPIEAYIVSQAYMKTQLDFPEEAEFPYTPVMSEIQAATDSLYRVIGDVTYKNAFGVKSKTRYNIRMKFKGGEVLNAHNWEVVDFDFVN